MDTYRGRAARWELKKAKSGTEYLEIWFNLVDHPGDQVRWSGSFTEAAYPYTFEAMRICGWNSATPAEIEDLSANEVELVLEEKTYNGRTTQEVKFINEPGRAQSLGQLSDTERKAFGAKMAGKVAAWHAQKGTKPAAQTARRPSPPSSARPPERDEPPPRSDDDIPF